MCLVGMLVNRMRGLQSTSDSDNKDEVHPSVILRRDCQASVLQPIWVVQQWVDIFISRIEDVVLIQRPLPNGTSTIQEKLDCLIDSPSRVDGWKWNNSMVIEVSDASSGIGPRVVDRSIRDI